MPTQQVNISKTDSHHEHLHLPFEDFDSNFFSCFLIDGLPHDGEGTSAQFILDFIVVVDALTFVVYGHFPRVHELSKIV